MAEKKASWGNQPETQQLLQPHADYKINLSIAQNFIAKVNKSLLEGMSISIANESMVLMITYAPPKDARMGNYAAPVNLHQAKYNFEKEMSDTFNGYYKMSQSSNELHRQKPRQAHLFDF